MESALNCATLAEMMLSLEQNGHSIETVIIEKRPGFSRHRMVQESIIGDFISHGFDLISTLDGLDLLSGNPTRKYIRQMLVTNTEYEKDMIVFELRAARDPKQAREGKCCIVCLNVRQASARCRLLRFRAVEHKTGPSSATGNHDPGR